MQLGVIIGLVMHAARCNNRPPLCMQLGVIIDLVMHAARCNNRPRYACS